MRAMPQGQENRRMIHGEIDKKIAFFGRLESEVLLRAREIGGFLIGKTVD